MTQYQRITVPATADLRAALAALNIPFEWLDADRLKIVFQMDNDLDQRLETLINDLAAIRWAYKPGRTMQMTLSLEAIP